MAGERAGTGPAPKAADHRQPDSYRADAIRFNEQFLSDRYELRYTTPAFIWTNYDWEFEPVADLSANYLGALALSYANVQLTDYQEMLLDQMEE